MFVAAKDIASNTLYVVQGHDHPWLLSHQLVAGNVSWVAGEPPAEGFACGAKTRYRQADAACVFGTATPGPEREARFSLAFDAAQWAVTPGQSPCCTTARSVSAAASSKARRPATGRRSTRPRSRTHADAPPAPT